MVAGWIVGLTAACAVVILTPTEVAARSWNVHAGPPRTAVTAAPVGAGGSDCDSGSSGDGGCGGDGGGGGGD